VEHLKIIDLKKMILIIKPKVLHEIEFKLGK